MAVIGWVSLLTWSIGDPSVNRATGGAPSNLLGTTGASLADMLLQFLGLTSIALFLPPADLGHHADQRRQGQPSRHRLAMWTLSLMLIASTLSILPQPKSWLLARPRRADRRFRPFDLHGHRQLSQSAACRDRRRHGLGRSRLLDADAGERRQPPPTCACSGTGPRGGASGGRDGRCGPRLCLSRRAPCRRTGCAEWRNASGRTAIGKRKIPIASCRAHVRRRARWILDTPASTWTMNRSRRPRHPRRRPFATPGRVASRPADRALFRQLARHPEAAANVCDGPSREYSAASAAAAGQLQQAPAVPHPGSG